MPLQKIEEADFEAIVAALAVRARHLLAREARLGSTSRLTGTARLSDDELRDRFKRLGASIVEFSAITRSFMAHRPGVINHDGIWPLLVEAEEYLRYDRFSQLKTEEVQTRLEGLWAAIDAIQGQVEHALQAAARLTDPVLVRLTPEEIEALGELTPDELEALGEFPAIAPESLQTLARLVSLCDSAGRCMSETRAILTGRFYWLAERGTPEKIRGKRLVAHLLGMSEGLGLFPTRDHDNHSQSGADAVIAALSRCKDITDPAARIVLGEAPKTFETIARRLWKQCREGEVLFLDRQLGRVLGERERSTGH